MLAVSAGLYMVCWDVRSKNILRNLRTRRGSFSYLHYARSSINSLRLQESFSVYVERPRVEKDVLVLGTASSFHEEKSVDGIAGAYSTNMINIST